MMTDQLKQLCIVRLSALLTSLKYHFFPRKKNGEAHVFDESFNQENGINLTIINVFPLQVGSVGRIKLQKKVLHFLLRLDRHRFSFQLQIYQMLRNDYKSCL